MKRNIFHSILILLTILMACKTKKLVVAPAPAVPVTELKDKKPENIALLKSKDIPFNTMAIRAKARLDFAGNENNVTMNFRIEKDKQIWVSVTAIAGIEVARALITPDSIKVRNNLQSTYLKKPFSYVYRYSNKQVSFALLQAMISGNTVADFLTEQSAITETNGIWSLNGRQENTAYKVFFNALLKTSEINLNDVKTGQALKVGYEPYQQLGDVLLPTAIGINSMAGTKKININLEYTKIDRNVPLEYPFTVPKKYELIN